MTKTYEHSGVYPRMMDLSVPSPYASIARCYLHEKVHADDFCHADLRTISKD